MAEHPIHHGCLAGRGPGDLSRRAGPCLVSVPDSTDAASYAPLLRIARRPEARPVWAAVAHPWVLAASAGRSAADADSLDLAQFGCPGRLVASRQEDRLLLSDGARSSASTSAATPFGDSPVRPSYELAGIQALERPLLLLRRLRTFVAAGRFVASLHPPPARASRLVQLDVLLRKGLERGRWRVHSPSVRSQAQRLARVARHMAGWQFWALFD